jgi:mannose-6-phosphate isomerase-like protein (cupin superfamily)
MPTTPSPPVLATVVADPAAIARLPWEPLPGFDHVTNRLLWRSGRSQCGIMHIPPGAEVSPHVHQRAHHHVWVLEGSAVLLGVRVVPGTYTHIPATVEHGFTDPGPKGCTVLYLYLRDEGDEGDDGADRAAGERARRREERLE